jgi:hypothetical protein
MHAKRANHSSCPCWPHPLRSPAGRTLQHIVRSSNVCTIRACSSRCEKTSPLSVRKDLTTTCMTHMSCLRRPAGCIKRTTSTLSSVCMKH